MHAGHMLSVKGNNKLRYNRYNVNGECISCNAFNESHLIWYAIHLKEKIGDVEFANLLNEAANKDTTEWTREELNNIITEYKSFT